MRVIRLARKPLNGTVAANVLEHGTGAIHIDACRVGNAGEADLAKTEAKNPGRAGELFTSNVYGAGRPQQSVNTAGRWPPNVIFQHLGGCRDGKCLPGCPVADLDEQSGDRKTTWVSPKHANNRSGEFLGAMGHPGDQGYNDSGGASRFYKQVGGSDE